MNSEDNEFIVPEDGDLVKVVEVHWDSIFTKYKEKLEGNIFAVGGPNISVSYGEPWLTAYLHDSAVPGKGTFRFIIVKNDIDQSPHDNNVNQFNELPDWKQWRDCTGVDLNAPDDFDPDEI